MSGVADCWAKICGVGIDVEVVAEASDERLLLDSAATGAVCCSDSDLSVG